MRAWPDPVEQFRVDAHVLEDFDDDAFRGSGSTSGVRSRASGRLTCASTPGDQRIEADVAECAEHDAGSGERSIDHLHTGCRRIAAIQQFVPGDLQAGIEDRLARDADQLPGGIACGFGHGGGYPGDEGTDMRQSLQRSSRGLCDLRQPRG
ncbi:MAG: hypothetical protein R3E65_08730 [Steroidobacteraceae bacterium]